MPQNNPVANNTSASPPRTAPSRGTARAGTTAARPFIKRADRRNTTGGGTRSSIAITPQHLTISLRPGGHGPGHKPSPAPVVGPPALAQGHGNRGREGLPAHTVQAPAGPDGHLQRDGRPLPGTIDDHPIGPDLRRRYRGSEPGVTVVQAQVDALPVADLHLRAVLQVDPSEVDAGQPGPFPSVRDLIHRPLALADAIQNGIPHPVPVHKLHGAV